MRMGRKDRVPVENKSPQNVDTKKATIDYDKSMVAFFASGNTRKDNSYERHERTCKGI